MRYEVGLMNRKGVLREVTFWSSCPVMSGQVQGGSDSPSQEFPTKTAVTVLPWGLGGLPSLQTLSPPAVCP